MFVQYILSNWHVLAGSPVARPGDEILQPGPYDGGTVSDTVANLARMMIDNDGDAALALLNGRRRADGKIYGTGDFLSGTKSPSLGEVLIKSGRTTGVTYGRVDGIGRYFIYYRQLGRRIGIDGFKLVAKTPGNPNNDEISSGGDSGFVLGFKRYAFANQLQSSWFEKPLARLHAHADQRYGA